MKATVLLTQECNLRCSYCDMARQSAHMSESLMPVVADFAYSRAAVGEPVEVVVIGGEPLLHPPLVDRLCSWFEADPRRSAHRTALRLVTNGTVFNRDIADLLNRHRMEVCLSIDGAPGVQDRHRRFPDGAVSSRIVRETIRQALEWLPDVSAHAVASPDTAAMLPDAAAWLENAGIRHIRMDLDEAASWTQRDAGMLLEAYRLIGLHCLQRFHEGSPLSVSWLDEKLELILRGGYAESDPFDAERREFTISTDGYVYADARFAGIGSDGGLHCLGHVLRPGEVQRFTARFPNPRATQEGIPSELPCASCGFRRFCRPGTGRADVRAYLSDDRAGESDVRACDPAARAGEPGASTRMILCASERAAITVALDFWEKLSAAEQTARSERTAGPDANRLPALPRAGFT